LGILLGIPRKTEQVAILSEKLSGKKPAFNKRPRNSRLRRFKRGAWKLTGDCYKGYQIVH
jgi:hypothetical protein